MAATTDDLMTKLQTIADLLANIAFALKGGSPTDPNVAKAYTNLDAQKVNVK